MTEPANGFLEALGRTPSGLFIVTAACEGARAAFLGSWVQQASLDPVLFSVAVHPDRYPYQLMKKSGRFALNIVPEGDKILLKTFAKGHGPESDPLAGVAHETVHGVPVLKDALAYAVLDVVSEARPGDHVIVFGTPIAGAVLQPGLKPWVHVRKSAAGY